MKILHEDAMKVFEHFVKEKIPFDVIGYNALTLELQSVHKCNLCQPFDPVAYAKAHGWKVNPNSSRLELPDDESELWDADWTRVNDIRVPDFLESRLKELHFGWNVVVSYGNAISRYFYKTKPTVQDIMMTYCKNNMSHNEVKEGDVINLMNATHLHIKKIFQGLEP